MERQLIEDRLIELVADAAALVPVTLDSRIEQDLRIRGDDLWPILEAIHDEFGTDFTTMDYGHFFHGEYYRIRDGLWWLYWRMTGKEITDKPEVTLRHIADVIERGQWFDPRGQPPGNP